MANTKPAKPSRNKRFMNCLAKYILRKVKRTFSKYKRSTSVKNVVYNVIKASRKKSQMLGDGGANGTMAGGCNCRVIVGPDSAIL